MFRFLAIVAILTPTPLLADDAETSELEIAARKYRLQVYASYRNRRSTYEAFIQAGKRVHSLWEENQNQRNALTVKNWFVQAENAVRTPGGTLPALPKIEPVIRVKKERTIIDSATSTNANLWPRSADRKMSSKQSSQSTQTMAPFIFAYLPDESSPVDRVTSELDDSPVESPIPAYVIHQDPNRRKFGSSIDLNILIARIESENLRLKLLEEKLNQADTSARSELNLVTAEFGELVEDRRLTELYWSNLSQQQRQIAPRPLSLKPIETLLQRVLGSSP